MMPNDVDVNTIGSGHGLMLRTCMQAHAGTCKHQLPRDMTCTPPPSRQSQSHTPLTLNASGVYWRAAGGNGEGSREGGRA